MITYPPVSILIPTRNSADLLDATIASLESLEYDRKKLFIMFADFGSSDGTLDKILSLPWSDGVGFYAMTGKRIGRTSLADTALNLRHQSMGGPQIALWPGDVLYPEALKILFKEYARAVAAAIDKSLLVIGEVDLRREDGTVHSQQPLFSKTCVTRGRSTDSGEFVRHGYRHAVFSYGYDYSCGKDKVQTQLNQRFWWNSLIGLGAWVDAVYVNQPVACLRERFHDDELGELVLKLEMCLSFLRASRDVPETTILDKDFESKYRVLLARFALWRAWLLHGRGEFKQAEDCYLFSPVIHAPIEKDDCFAWTRKLVEEGSEAAAAWLEEYYDREDQTLRPKWPLGGWFTTLWNRFRMSGTRSSKWRSVI